MPTEPDGIVEAGEVELGAAPPVGADRPGAAGRRWRNAGWYVLLTALAAVILTAPVDVEEAQLEGTPAEPGAGPADPTAEPGSDGALP